MVLPLSDPGRVLTTVDRERFTGMGLSARRRCNGVDLQWSGDVRALERFRPRHHAVHSRRGPRRHQCGDGWQEDAPGRGHLVLDVHQPPVRSTAMLEGLRHDFVPGPCGRTRKPTRGLILDHGNPVATECLGAGLSLHARGRKHIIGPKLRSFSVTFRRRVETSGP